MAINLSLIEQKLCVIKKAMQAGIVDLGNDLKDPVVQQIIKDLEQIVPEVLNIVGGIPVGVNWAMLPGILVKELLNIVSHVNSQVNNGN